MKSTYLHHHSLYACSLSHKVPLLHCGSHDSHPADCRPDHAHADQPSQIILRLSCRTERMWMNCVAAMAIARPDNSRMLCKSVNMAAIVLKGHKPTSMDPGAPFLAHTYCTKQAPGHLRVVYTGTHGSGVFSILCRSCVGRGPASDHLTTEQTPACHL